MEDIARAPARDRREPKGCCSVTTPVPLEGLGSEVARGWQSKTIDLSCEAQFRQYRGAAMSRLMLKSAKRASLVENLRSLRGLDKMRVR
jgi:hypothetical protein